MRSKFHNGYPICSPHNVQFVFPLQLSIPEQKVNTRHFPNSIQRVANVKFVLNANEEKFDALCQTYASNSKDWCALFEMTAFFYILSLFARYFYFLKRAGGKEHTDSNK